MLYSEFLEGTKAPDNLYTYSEYERINKVYTDCDLMTKQEAYKMYMKPSKVIQELLTMLDEERSQAREIAYQYYKLEKEHNELLESHRKEHSARISLQATLDEAAQKAHDLYYLLTD